MNSTSNPTGNLSVQQMNMMSYFQLYSLQFYIQRIIANLGIINNPPNSVTVTVMKTTLFNLAAQFYGDATQWPVIANANNLIDPNITAITTLIIPPWNQQDTGGIL